MPVLVDVAMIAVFVAIIAVAGHVTKTSYVTGTESTRHELEAEDWPDDGNEPH